MPPYPPPVPKDPLEWRPQRALETRRPVEIRDPLVEPLWSGTRLIAHVTSAGATPQVRFLDAFGVDIAPEEPRLATALAEALAADDAVLDVILTAQATTGGVGAAVVTESRTSMMSLLTSREVGVEIQRRGEPEESEEAVVALDLLRLDGDSLLEVPLLERKRLLESVIEQTEIVRVSVHARPPVDPWVATWKSAGLRGAILKAANSRYVPGSFSDQWREVTRVAGRR
jgi:bifunctional non-homologous end joining protein LigD